MYGGEHYVLDEVAGIAYALVVLAVARRVRERRSADRAVPRPVRDGEPVRH
jgi:hypothetical protein